MKTEPDELLPTRWTLIQRLKNWDDHESWREFFDIYWKLIYGVARKSGLTPDEAQEVVQETVVSLCKNIKNFKADPSQGSFKAWLFQLTRWRITDQVRKRPPEALGRAHRAAHPGQEDSRSTATEERIMDPASNQLDKLWEQEWERNLISVALERLERQTNAKHYQVYFLHVIKQHPAEQVAKIAGIEVDQVYVIKSRLTPLFREAITALENKPI